MAPSPLAVWLTLPLAQQHARTKEPRPPPPRRALALDLWTPSVIGTRNTTPAVYFATLLCTNPCNPHTPTLTSAIAAALLFSFMAFVIITSARAA